ncbi:MAG: hypothetical protein QF501_06060 [Anaerolineales bacterium]|nr:hypothetical protein [Anaerolineales bacterium]
MTTADDRFTLLWLSECNVMMKRASSLVDSFLRITISGNHTWMG